MNHGFGMLTLYVSDMEKAKAFYTEFLGMQFLADFSSPTFVLLRPVQGTQIALQPLSELPEGEAKRAGGFEVNLEVEDLDAAWQAWNARGIPVLTEIADMGVGRWFRAKDTEGNMIAIYQMYPQFKQ